MIKKHKDNNYFLGRGCSLSKEVFMKYVGLTNNLKERKQGHGNPKDFRLIRIFKNKQAARKWEKLMLAKPGYKGGPGGKGWRYGYTYTITKDTVE